MKLPKNRGNIFLVIRDGGGKSANLGAFASIDDADDYRNACAQAFLEKVGAEVASQFEFKVELTTFYG